MTLAVVSQFRIAQPHTPAPSGARSAWGVLLQDRLTVALIAGTLVMGQAYGAIGTFLFLRLQELRGSPLLMGLTLAANCAVEAPMFHFSGAVIRRLDLHLD